MKPIFITSLICFINITNVTASYALRSSRFAASTNSNEEGAARPSSSSGNPLYDDDTSDSSTSVYRRRFFGAATSNEDESGSSYDIESSSYSEEESETSCSEDSDYTCDSGVKRRGKKKTRASVTASASSSGRQTRSSSSSRKTAAAAKVTDGSISDDSEKVIFKPFDAESQAEGPRLAYLDEDFKQKSIELIREIKAFAKEQLGLDCSDKDIRFNDYEIENWPELVPFHPKNWDQQAYDDLYKVLPTLVFRKKNIIAAKANEEAARNLKKMRRDLLDRLVVIFNEQTGEASKRVPWTKYNLTGWPVRINLAIDRLNRSEILIVWRKIDSIKFLPLEPGQKIRFVEFSDGSRWEFNGKVPNRIEFTALLRKYDLASNKSPVAAADSETPSKKEAMDVVPSSIAEPSTSSHGPVSLKRKNRKASTDSAPLKAAKSSNGSRKVTKKSQREASSSSATATDNQSQCSEIESEKDVKASRPSQNHNSNYDFEFEGLGFDFEAEKEQMYLDIYYSNSMRL